MKKIRSFNNVIREIPLSLGLNKITLPKRAQVISVNHADRVLVLTLVCEAQPLHDVERIFYAARSQDSVPHGLGHVTHIGTSRHSMQGAAHVFELDSPEDGSNVGTVRRESARGGNVVTNVQNGPVHGTSVQIGSILGDARRGVMIQ